MKANTNQPLKIAAVYFIAGASWILLSDKILQIFVKGWFYVTVTTFLNFALVHTSMKRIVKASIKINQMNDGMARGIPRD